MPVRTERTMNYYGFTEETALNHTVNGIRRNFWSENEWVIDSLNPCIFLFR